MMDSLGRYSLLVCRSHLFCKYRLCCTLLRRGVASVTGGGMESDPNHLCMTFDEFLLFESGLQQTVASSLVAVWVCCEGHHLGVKQQWAAQHSIRTHCTALPFLADMVRGVASRQQASCSAGNGRW